MTNSDSSASCRIAGAGWSLTFSLEVLQTIGSHVQETWRSKESVGQLYSRDLTPSNIVVGHSTTLPRIRAHYSGVQFDPKVAASERAMLFRDGWHCIGLWHSHPEAHPHPSPTDSVLAKDHARAAASHLNGLVFAILGTQPLPSGLSVWLHDGERFLSAEWAHPQLSVDEHVIKPSAWPAAPPPKERL